MKMIWNSKTYFKGRSWFVGGEGEWRRRWEGKGRRSLRERLLLVDLSQFILMWFLWTDNCHQDNAFSSQSLSLFLPQAVLEQSLCRGGELLSESRQRIVVMEVSCFHYSHCHACSVAPHGNHWKQVEALLAALRSGEVSPQEVLEAFQAKALVVDRFKSFIIKTVIWKNLNQ